MKKTLVVLSKDKLMATDTVAPVVREFKKKTGGRVFFYIPSFNSIEQLKQNFVLYDAINEVAEIRPVSYGFGLKRKALYIKNLVFWLSLAIRGAKFIHFGMLNIWPFRILTWINANNIFYMQNDTYYHTNIEIQAKANKLGKVDAILYNKWADEKSLSGNNIITNSKHSFFLKNPNNKHKNIFVYRGSRLRPSWIDFIKRKQDLYSEYYQNINFSNGIIVYVLSTFEPVADLRNENSTELLFINTIKILDKLNLNLPILIKPHAYTQMDVVYNALDKVDSKNFHITYFHPTLLSLKAKAWICNLYSTTCADAYCMGVKTIEYTNYSDNFLKASLGKSVGYQYVDYFIQNNDSDLSVALTEAIDSSNELAGLRCNPLDDNNLLDALTSTKIHI